MFMETSAKAGHNVKSLFKKIAMSLVGMEKDNEATEQQNTSTFGASTTLECVLIVLDFEQKSMLQRPPTTTYPTLPSVLVDCPIASHVI